MKQGEGAKSRNWQGRKRKLASTARGHERQHETTFLERVSRAEYTVPTSFFIWGQERTLSGVRISTEGKKPSPFMKAELSQIFFECAFFLEDEDKKGIHICKQWFSSWPAKAFLYNGWHPRDVGALCFLRPILVVGRQSSSRVWEVGVSYVPLWLTGSWRAEPYCPPKASFLIMLCAVS